jgi:hypothetical protein
VNTPIELAATKPVVKSLLSSETKKAAELWCLWVFLMDYNMVG